MLLHMHLVVAGLACSESMKYQQAHNDPKDDQGTYGKAINFKTNVKPMLGIRIRAWMDMLSA